LAPVWLLCLELAFASLEGGKIICLFRAVCGKYFACIALLSEHESDPLLFQPEIVHIKWKFVWIIKS
jgi:hypothetical protein